MLCSVAILVWFVQIECHSNKDVILEVVQRINTGMDVQSV